MTEERAKAEAVAEAEAVAVAAMVCLVPSKRYPHFAGVELQLYGGYEPVIGDLLVPASVVAALEAEVEENEGVIRVWRRRCEEAERRVAELLKAVRAAHDRLHYLTIKNGLKLDADLVVELKQALTGSHP